MLPSVAVVVIVALAASRIHQRREWFRIQTEQIEAFTSLEKFPPKGRDLQSWRSAIATPIKRLGECNVSPRSLAYLQRRNEVDAQSGSGHNLEGNEREQHTERR